MKKILAVLLVLLLAASASATVSTFAKDTYTGDGSTGQAFTITFEFFASSEVVATSRVTATGVEAVLAETTDYTITGTGSDPYTGGTLTLVASLANTSTITISRAMAQNQETDLQTGGLPSDTLEDQYDKLAMQIQDLQEQINRCVRIPVTDLADDSTIEDDMEVSSSIDRASSYFIFDSDGSPSMASGELDSTVTTTTYTEGLLDDANEGDLWTSLGFSAGVQSVLDDATLAAMKTTLGITAITVLDEDDMGAGAGSDSSPPSQDSVYEFLVTTAATMASKTLTSPVLNTGVSGTAVLDENNMASDSDTQLATQQSIKAYVDAAIPASPPYVQYSYTVASGTDGGGSTKDSWQTRTVDTEDSDDDNIGAVVANQITLDAGTYRFAISMTVYRTGDSVCRLYNTTGAALIARSTNAYCASGANGSAVLVIHGEFTIAAAQALELQYFCRNTIANVGLGNALTTGGSEVYAILSFWQVST